MVEELPILPFIAPVSKADLSDWKQLGIPSTARTSPYLGYYFCVGPIDPPCVEKASNQQVAINYTGSPGKASSLYYNLTFQLINWKYNVIKIDEWIEVNPVHREYYERTIASKGMLEGTIKEGLRSAAQAIADYELVKHDLRKYKEMMDYLAVVEAAKKEKDEKKRREKLLKAEHTLKSMFIDQVDIHNGATSLVEMARTRWPTVISDFMAITEDDDTVEKIMKRLGISKAEAVILKTKNMLFREWLKLFGDVVKERYEMLTSLAVAREKSIKEYRDWLKPYITRYRALKVGHERPELRKTALSSFVDLTGQATFGNFIKLWAFKPFVVVEARKPAIVRAGKFVLEPYDKWAELFVKHPKYGLAAIYPWLLNRGKAGTVADDIINDIKEKWIAGKYTGLSPNDLYYLFFDISVDRIGIRLPVGEVEDITFTIKTWILSQNIMLVKLVERECREREIDRYIEEMLGIKKEEKPIQELVKGEFPELFGESPPKPGLLEKIKSEWSGTTAEVSKIMDGIKKIVESSKIRFVKPGPYESEFTERITKQYLIPSGRAFGAVVGFLLAKMGVG